MEPSQNIKFTKDRLQNLINSVTKCKLEFNTEKEECKRLREINTKLEVELKEAVELEKSHRYHLLTSREMIGNLQETVTQLLYLKRDVKKLNDEIASKDATLASTEKEKENYMKQFDKDMEQLRSQHEKHIEELTAIHEKKIQQIQYHSETEIAQCNSLIEELRGKVEETENEHKDKMNVVVLEYEEKIQRSATQVAQLQEQLSRQTARTDANIDAYRRKLEDLEEKLKQNQFKDYLAQSSFPSQYESQVERPFSESRNYSDFTDHTSSETIKTDRNTNKTQKSKPLQVTYKENKTWGVPKTNEKKGPFNITKKRKLYSEKDFLN